MYRTNHCETPVVSRPVEALPAADVDTVALDERMTSQPPSPAAGPEPGQLRGGHRGMPSAPMRSCPLEIDKWQRHRQRLDAMLCDVCSAGIGTIGQRERLIHDWFPISFFHLRGERQAHAVRRDKDPWGPEANARSA